jgi:SNF2 family DNA or RNA helicase
MRQPPTIDRPPLWEGLHFEEIERPNNARELQELRFTRALGYPSAAARALDLLKQAGAARSGGRPLAEHEGERLARLIARLTDLWASWTDTERATFSDRYLDHSKQPNSARPTTSRHTSTYNQTPRELARLPFTPHLYQARAVHFALESPRCLLALEMGLGKTLIALIAYHAMRDRRELQRAIISAPKSAHSSWAEHLAYSDAPSVTLTAAAPAKREQAYKALWEGALSAVVVTPQTLARDYGYFKKILTAHPTLLIADEVHKAKALDSQIGRAFEALSERAARVIGLTGTPAPTHIDDFYYIVDRIAPNTLGDLQEFSDRYTYKLFDQWSSSTGATYRAGAVRPDRLAELYDRLEPVAFIRTTADPDAAGATLPPRIDLAPYIPMDDKQRAILEALARQQRARELHPQAYEAALRGEGGELEQIAAEGATATAQALGIRIEQLGITPAIFSPTFGARYPDYEAPKVRMIANATISHLKEHPSSAAVIFCEYTAGLEAMRQALERRGLTAQDLATYQGSTSPKQRRKLTKALNEGGLKVLLGQTKALETGANLQARATFVAHLSTPWSPDTLAQSTARVYRQGQRHRVTVLRPSSSALEEAKNRALTRKILNAAQLTGALTTADAAIMDTTADPRVRKAQNELLERGAYSYGIISALTGADFRGMR